MTIKVITLNIWKGRLLPRVISFLKRERPDFLFMQEVFNGQGALPEYLRSYELLVSSLGYRYQAFAPECLYDLRQGKIPHGNAIFSKFPIREGRTIFFDIGYREDYLDSPGNYEYHPRNLQQVRARVKRQDIHLMNTHGIWELSGRDNPRRLAMSRTICEAIRGKRRVILAGDFNLPPATATIRNIQRLLTSVFGEELPTSFNLRRKTNPDYADVVVDMIFVSPDLRVVAKRAAKVDVSDHLPLICTLMTEDAPRS